MHRYIVRHLGYLTALALGLTLMFAAGGTTDILARIVGEELSKRLGQQIVIDNRPGAGGGSVRSRGSLPDAPSADRFSMPLFERSRAPPWTARIATRRRPPSGRGERFMASGAFGAGIAGGGSTSGPARC